MTSTLRHDMSTHPDGPGDWIIQIDAESEWGDYKMEPWADLGLPYLGPISECPAAILDVEFDAGYGAPARPMWRMWTTNYVVTCTEYDGATGTAWEPRNPPTEEP